MKVWVTKTSDWRYGKMVEYESLKDCIDTLFETEKHNLVISKVPDWYPDEAKQCEYKVEIYDTWRE